MRQVSIEPDFESWREAARSLLIAGVPPGEAAFVEAGLDHALLPSLAETIESAKGEAPSVPREFVRLAEVVACHTSSDHWELLYRVLWRLTHGEQNLLRVTIDDDIHRLLMMEKQVRFDAHKMKAFVRFRKVVDESGERFVAWHRSEHRVLKRTAPFFVRRFGIMKWSILTQFDSAHWDGHELTFGPGMPRDAAPREDELESLWRTYYASIFNPNRIKLRAMQKEMPRRYWSTMPETQLIPELLVEAPARSRTMVEQGRRRRSEGAADYLPVSISLPTLRDAVRSCRGCDICENATQAVFGEGSETALVVFVGEQPGDQEDRAGRPFVGPAGRVFDQALAQVGIDRSQTYVTNAVKHFKFEQRGIRRIHSRPSAREMSACKPWIEAELLLIKPQILVLLGSTAAQSLIGAHFRITRVRGRPFASDWAPWTIATFHPSALLRIPDEMQRARTEAEFVADLRLVAEQLKLREVA